MVPAPGDNVFIDFPGSYTVALDQNVTVAALTVGGAGGEQTLVWTFGVIDGAARVTVAVAMAPQRSVSRSSTPARSRCRAAFF